MARARTLVSGLGFAIAGGALLGCPSSGGAKGASGAGGAGGEGVAGGSLAGCPVFPADDPWNTDVSGAPVDPASDAIIADIQANGGGSVLRADFGAGADSGIPYVVVPADQPGVPVSFEYADESDPGPYPIPANPPIEPSGDRHILVVQTGSCTLFEIFDASPDGAGWHGGAGARFDLRVSRLRPDGWTSADAAGLPVFPGLVRWDEAVGTGAIRHALRFTVKRSRRAYVHPATHWASSDTGETRPPMGARLRLKASFDVSTFHGAARVILVALRSYGMFVADNGSNWYVSGASDPRFDDDDLRQLGQVPGEAFEVVQMGALHTP